VEQSLVFTAASNLPVGQFRMIRKHIYIGLARGRRLVIFCSVMPLLLLLSTYFKCLAGTTIGLDIVHFLAEKEKNAKERRTEQSDTKQGKMKG